MAKAQALEEKYRGFELEVHRGEAMGGWENTYFTAMRSEDGWMLVDDFTSGRDRLTTIMKILRARVDDFFENPDDYKDGN